jgi:uncharacterized protein YkwD
MPRRRHFLIVCTVALAACAAAASATAAFLTQTEAELIGAVNRTRVAHGVKPLRVDSRLERAARAHSAEMMRTDSFTHGAFSQRMKTAGPSGPVFGENLAWGAGIAVVAVVADWLASPEHRANLLRPGYRRIGVGVTKGRFEGYPDAMLVTADFGGT